MVSTTYGRSARWRHVGDRRLGYRLQHGRNARYRTPREPSPIRLSRADPAKGLAIALIAGLGAQVLLGLFAHWYKPKSKTAVPASGRGILHFAHIGLGLIVVIVGWATALTGMSSLSGFPLCVGVSRLTQRLSSTVDR